MNLKQNNLQEIHNHTNFLEPKQALEMLLEENKRLIAEKAQLIKEKEALLKEKAELIHEKQQLLKEKEALIKKQAGQPANLWAHNGTSPAEVEELKRQLAVAKAELKVLKTDIENFKSWTKKLDWSTANIPDALTKHYEIKQANGVKGTFPDGTPNTQSGQRVDNVWHGPYVIVDDTDQTVFRGNFVNGEDHGERNITNKGECPGEEKEMYWMGKNLNKCIDLNTDGGVQYICADEEDKGVSVTVLTEEGQNGWCYYVKNGYKVWLYTYNDEICVRKIENDQEVSGKWYQLKK